MADTLIDPAQFTAENFWDALTAVYRRQFTSYAERPWVFGVAKAGGSLTLEMLAKEPLAELWQQAQFLLVQFLRRGRELGVIRNDWPEALLLSLLIAVDDAHDRWLFGPMVGTVAGRPGTGGRPHQRRAAPHIITGIRIKHWFVGGAPNQPPTNQPTIWRHEDRLRNESFDEAIWEGNGR